MTESHKEIGKWRLCSNVTLSFLESHKEIGKQVFKDGVGDKHPAESHKEIGKWHWFHEVLVPEEPNLIKRLERKSMRD